MALKNYLAVRQRSIDSHVFLNYEGVGLSRRGAEKIIEKYRSLSGITKRFSAHSLRHTFGSYKAEQGILWIEAEKLGFNPQQGKLLYRNRQLSSRAVLRKIEPDGKSRACSGRFTTAYPAYYSSRCDG